MTDWLIYGFVVVASMWAILAAPPNVWKTRRPK
jgi:hypothetical protein